MQCMGTIKESRICPKCEGSRKTTFINRDGELDVEECFDCYGVGTYDVTVPCLQVVSWIRRTQFAGNHPFCKDCAKLELDFGKEDSYSFWEKIKTNTRK